MKSHFSAVLAGGFLAALVSCTATAAITHRQDIGKASLAATGAGHVVTLSIPVTNAVLKGDMIAINVAVQGTINSSLNPLIPTDSASDTYVEIGATDTPSFNLFTFATTANSDLSAGSVISLQYQPSGFSPFTVITIAEEFSGVSAITEGAGPIVEQPANTATTFDTNNTVALLTTNADDLLYAAVAVQSSVGGTGVTPTSTPIFAPGDGISTAGMTLIPLYSATSAAGSYHLAGTIDSTGTPPAFIVMMHAFKASAVTAGAILSVSKSHVGNFTQNQNGATYTLSVANNGNAATNGTVTVTDTLPTGLSFVSGSGSGWTCSAGGSAQQITCTSSTAIAAGGASSVDLRVNVAANAASLLVNTATVSCTSPCSSDGVTASDPTTVIPQVVISPPAAVTQAPFLGGYGLWIMAVLICVGATRALHTLAGIKPIRSRE